MWLYNSTSNVAAFVGRSGSIRLWLDSWGVSWTCRERNGSMSYRNELCIPPAVETLKVKLCYHNVWLGIHRTIPVHSLCSSWVKIHLNYSPVTQKDWFENLASVSQKISILTGLQYANCLYKWDEPNYLWCPNPFLESSSRYNKE